MFNHEQLMKAADAHVHASDIPYENFLNIYKLAFDQIKDLSKADNLRDRLVITTANQVVDVLTKAARSSAVGFITIRLAMQSGVRIKRSEASKLAIRDWTLEQVKTLGVKLDGDRTSQRAAATQVGKQVLRTAPTTDMNIVAYEMDVDALVKNGKLEAGRRDQGNQGAWGGCDEEVAGVVHGFQSRHRDDDFPGSDADIRGQGVGGA